MIVGLRAHAGALRMEDKPDGAEWEEGRHNTIAGRYRVWIRRSGIARSSTTDTQIRSKSQP
jgi:hypothetical protein